MLLLYVKWYINIIAFIYKDKFTHLLSVKYMVGVYTYSAHE